MADILTAQSRARLRLIRNGVTLYDQEFDTGKVDFDEYAHHRAVLATNMASPDQVSLQGVTTGDTVLVTTDRAIKLGINSSTALLDIKDVFLMTSDGNVAQVWVQNANTTFQATVTVLVVENTD